MRYYWKALLKKGSCSKIQREKVVDLSIIFSKKQKKKKERQSVINHFNNCNYLI